MQNNTKEDHKTGTSTKEYADPSQMVFARTMEGLSPESGLDGAGQRPFEVRDLRPQHADQRLAAPVAGEQQQSGVIENRRHVSATTKDGRQPTRPERRTGNPQREASRQAVRESTEMAAQAHVSTQSETSVDSNRSALERVELALELDLVRAVLAGHRRNVAQLLTQRTPES